MIHFNNNGKAYSFKLSSGLGAGQDSALVIKELANHFKKEPLIRRLAVSICNGLPSNDITGEAKAIYEWVRNTIRYIKDIRGVETLQTPFVTLPAYISEEGIGAGDCDDHVILLASLLLSIGVKNLSMRLVNYSFDSQEWQHIYLVWRCQNGREISMDPIKKNGQFGWQVSYINKKDIKL